MKAFKKFPVLALLCFSAVGTTFSGAAIAGSTTTAGADAEPSSSIGVIFVPLENISATVTTILSSPALATAISNVIFATLTTLSGGGSLTSVGGFLVVLPANSADVITEAINSVIRLAENDDSEQIVATKNLGQLEESGNAGTQLALEQQITDELAESGVEMDVSPLVESIMGLGNSPERLPVATEAMNDLVMSASRVELEALASSPSITAIRQILNDGNSVL
ncbi:MAG: hypothetical protein AAFQ63_02850 [Cyanobacteria bacterium J06621_11]